MHWRRLPWCLMACGPVLSLAVLLGGEAHAGAPLPPKHLGVASCASSTCHGRVTPDPNSDVALDEYFIWSKYDAHSRAYTVLQDDWARRIASNMGLKEAPSKARQCLACHADDVPKSRRGPQFQLSDGVGCEACHGGAQHWNSFHTSRKATYAADLEHGMQPTDDPTFLAPKCLGCHMGDKTHLATHEMMAAGHPRLRFELDAWLANMPPHWVVDADYRRRKQVSDHVDRWAAGIVAAARGYLRMLPVYINRQTMMPQLTLFDCQSCHRLMDTKVVRSSRERHMVKAGTLRPDDQDILILAVITGVRDKDLADAIRHDNAALNRSAGESTDMFLHRASTLLGRVTQAGHLVSARSFSMAERESLRRALLEAGAAGTFRDYSDANQFFLALQVLAVQAGGDQNRYDQLFQLLNDPRTFDPRRVAAEARRLLK